MDARNWNRNLPPAMELFSAGMTKALISKLALLGGQGQTGELLRFLPPQILQVSKSVLWFHSKELFSEYCVPFVKVSVLVRRCNRKMHYVEAH